jgi:micrococcal nuclease
LLAGGSIFMLCMRRIPALLVLFFLCGSFIGKSNGTFNGKVIAVHDGNTIEVIDEKNQSYKIILAGVDCPELQQKFGDQAKRFVEKKLLQKTVRVEIIGKDRKGNYTGVVTLGSNDVRIDLLKEGLAWTAEKNPDPDLEPYRVWAQKKGKGLWKEPNPQAPWTFRREQSMARPKSS